MKEFKLYSTLLLLTVLKLAEASDYVIDRCYCYEDPEFQELTLNRDGMTPPRFCYIGVKVNKNDNREPCICYEVTLVQTVLKVTDTDIVNNGKLSDTAAYAYKLTERTLSSLKHQMGSAKQDLSDRIAQITMPGLGNYVNDKLEFNIEFVIMGQDESLLQTVQDGFIAATQVTQDTGEIITAIESTHNGETELVTIDATGMTFTVTKCTDDPPEAPEFGDILWNGQLLGGSLASYECDEKYIIANESNRVSFCDHVSGTWTAVEPECVPGCAGDIPKGPVFTVPDWADKPRLEGTVVDYPCRKGYKSKHGNNATVTCVDGNWTAIQHDGPFACEEIVCELSDMPQLPAWAELFWNGLLSDGTEAFYGCIAGYKPFLGEKGHIKCKNSIWSSLPEGWTCVSNNVEIKAEIDARIEEETRAERELDDIERRDKALLNQPKNLFIIYTVPSIAALAAILACCFCVSRTDCLCFTICNRRYLRTEKFYTETC